MEPVVFFALIAGIGIGLSIGLAVALAVELRTPKPFGGRG